MISIKLYDPETDKVNYYEQRKINFGKIKKILDFNKDIEEKSARLRILEDKLTNGVVLTKPEEKEFVSLSGENEVGMLESMIDIVVDLFNNPNVTKEAIYNGLDLQDGVETLRTIMSDAMGGANKDNSKK